MLIRSNMMSPLISGEYRLGDATKSLVARAGGCTNGQACFQTIERCVDLMMHVLEVNIPDRHRDAVKAGCWLDFGGLFIRFERQLDNARLERDHDAVLPNGFALGKY